MIVGVQTEDTDGIAAGAFRDGDQTGGAFPDALGEELLGGHVGGLVEFGQKPAGQVVQVGGEARPAGRVQQLGGVEDIGAGADEVPGAVGPEVERVEQALAGERTRGTGDGALVIQIRQVVQEGKQGDLGVAEQLAQVRDPIEEIILDASAAHQQGNGVDGDAQAAIFAYGIRAAMDFRLVNSEIL
jgi:hypothetical protein